MITTHGERTKNFLIYNHLVQETIATYLDIHLIRNQGSFLDQLARQQLDHEAHIANSKNRSKHCQEESIYQLFWAIFVKL